MWAYLDREASVVKEDYADKEVRATIEYKIFASLFT